MSLFARWTCCHDWEVLTQETLPSAYEQVGDSRGGVETSDLVALFQKTFVAIMTCRKCGAIRKFVERNP